MKGKGKNDRLDGFTEPRALHEIREDKESYEETWSGNQPASNETNRADVDR